MTYPGQMQALQYLTRARSISFFWADTNVFHFSLPMTDIFALLKLQMKGITVHFFFRPHQQKKNNYRSYNYEKVDCGKLRTRSVYFAL